MSRILLAWEQGANYGHLAQLAMVALPLRAAGHQVCFAVRELQAAGTVLAARGLEFVQAPVFRHQHRVPALPASHAEALALEGYASAGSAGSLVAAWLKLLSLYRAEVLVADCSPGALVAARIHALPAAQVGNGFSIPPLAAPMPAFRTWGAAPAARLAQAEEQLIGALNVLFQQHGTAGLACLADLFRTEARIFATYPELDPFGPRDGERYVGPLVEQELGEAVSWVHSGEPRILAYLRPEVPGARNILAALARAPAQTLCVAPGMRAAAVREFAGANVRLVTSPVQLMPVLQEASLVVGYGGHGLICAALASGVPLLLAPANVEQYLHARRAESSGVAAVLGSDRSVETVAAAIEMTLGNRALRSGARQFADRNSLLAPARAAAAAAAVVMALAG